MSHDLWVPESFSLIEVYNQIHLKFPFEVVLVPFTRPHDHIRHPRVDPHRSFTSIFSSLPWTAIPYSDVTSCQRLLTTFGFTAHVYPNTPVIDPTGLVLDLYANSLFESFGACGYPFTRQRINLLVSEDEAILKYPSIWNLLASPERDYVISNNGDKVHIQSLEDKVVALHFFELGFSPTYSGLSERLMIAYEQLTKTKNFEVVLIYVYDTSNTLHCTNEDTFWKTFKKMPWLALPFKDPVIKKLKRICRYPLDLDGPEPDPGLVIVGPRGAYFEPYGADIFMNFGIPTYPFTRRKMVDLVAGKAKSVKLDMLWDSNTVLRRRDESEVKFSEVVGKNIILLIWNTRDRASADSLSILKSKYNLMKGTDGEFEVIQLLDLGEQSDYKEHATDIPWLVHPFEESSHWLSLLLDAAGDARLLAFNRHGQVVRRATYLCFEVGEDAKFPFSAAGDLEKEVYAELYRRFSWYCWHQDSILRDIDKAIA